MSHKHNDGNKTHAGEHLVKLMADAMSGCDMAKVEGRAWFVTQAKRVWLDLKSGKQKSELLCLVSELAMISEATLVQLWGGDVHPRTSSD